MTFLQPLRARFLLLTLTLFYDVAFVDRLWTDPRLRRASLGLLGILITGIAALLYALDLIYFSASLYPYTDISIFIGLGLFVSGSWRSSITIAFDLPSSQQTLRSRETVICNLGDTMQASAYIEGLVNQSQVMVGGNHLKATEYYLVFATEIWIESLARNGLNLLGDIFTTRSIGEMIASKDSMPSV